MLLRMLLTSAEDVEEETTVQPIVLVTALATMPVVNTSAASLGAFSNASYLMARTYSKLHQKRSHPMSYLLGYDTGHLRISRKFTPSGPI